MKNILLINISPRQKGTSAVLAGMCREYLETRGHRVNLLHLYASLDKPDALYQAVKEADTIVISGPCYINTYPADTIRLLEELARRPELLHGQSLYGMIQGGMPTVHTHESGLSMLDSFGRKTGVTYKGGFVMGMGAMLNGQPVDKLFNAKKVKKQLSIFFDHIEKGGASPREVYEAAQMKFPIFMLGMMTKVMNRFIDKDLKKHGIDPKQENPYLSDTMN